jgi:hypothetical protein
VGGVARQFALFVEGDRKEFSPPTLLTVCYSLLSFGGADGIRTHDLLDAIESSDDHSK